MDETYLRIADQWKYLYRAASAAGRRQQSDIDYRKQKRSNETHQSTTDPLARLYKKSSGSEARLAYLGHILTENRNGLVVNTRVTLATGTAERDAANRGSVGCGGAC